MRFETQQIQGICVTVAHRTLTPFAGVRIPHPLPFEQETWEWKNSRVFLCLLVNTTLLRRISSNYASFYENNFCHRWYKIESKNGHMTLKMTTENDYAIIDCIPDNSVLPSVSFSRSADRSNCQSLQRPVAFLRPWCAGTRKIRELKDSRISLFVILFHSAEPLSASRFL